MTMITPSYLGETIEYSSLHACRSTLEDPTALTTGPDGGKPVLDRYYWGGLYSTNFWIVPQRDLVLVLMTQVLPTNHGSPDQVFYRAVNAAIEK